jgi:TP901 family phage tail tape measure protein
VAEVAKGIIDIEINTGSAASSLQALQAQINAFNLALNKGNAIQGKFSGEYSKKLQEAINKTGLFTAETIRLQTAAATLDKTLSKGKTSLGQYFSARFNKDGAIAAETMALASERARRLQTQFIATSGAANGFQDALAVRPLAAFSSQVAVAGQKAEIMSAMFKQGTTQLINFGKNVQWAGRQLMVGFTVPLTIFGAVAGKTFMELEKQVVGFKKVYGDLFTTPAELNQNLEAVKGLASEYTKYGIAVKDTIGLAAQAAAAGRKGADLSDAVSQATRLATLGQMDQNAALETTISLQSAFRLSGQDLADTINFLNMVENQTVVSLQDIAAAIPRVAPVIQGLGGDVKDLTVFLAAMQEGGVDAAEGANALKSGLASLINPTRQATDMLTGMGINLQSIIDLNKGDLMGTVMSFSQALSSLDQFSRQQALEQVFGKFQYAKLGALFENITRQGSQAQQVIATMGYTTEQLGSTAEKELKTIEESFGVQLTGAMERFKLAIAPIGEIFVKLAIPLVNFATSVAEAFNGLSDGQKKFAAIGAVVIGVVVPAVTMLTGLFLNLVGTLAKMTQGVTLFGMGFIKGGPLGAVKALTQSSKYLSLAEMDAAMAAQQLAGANEALNATLVKQVGSSNAAATAIGNLTKAYAAMISTQSAAASRFPEIFGVAGKAGATAKASQVVMRGVQRRNSGGPIFMSNGTTVPGTGNTDTVPAMLTPGEFVVNKEATKNNLGLLHNINNSKNPQGLNAGGKARGMQYLMAGQLVKGMFDNIPGGFASLGSKISRRLSPHVNFKIRSSKSGRVSQVKTLADSVNKIAPMSKAPELARAFKGSRFFEELGIVTTIFPRQLNKNASSGGGGAKVEDIEAFIRIAGRDFLEPFRKAYVDSGGPRGLGTSAIIKRMKSQLAKEPRGTLYSDDDLKNLLNNSIKDKKVLEHIEKMRTDPSNTGQARILGIKQNAEEKASRFGIKVPRTENGTSSTDAQNALIKAMEDDLYKSLKEKVTVVDTLERYRTKAVFEARNSKGETLLRFTPGDTFSTGAGARSYNNPKYRGNEQRKSILKRLETAFNNNSISKEQYDMFKTFDMAHFNKGGQVPGMQYFAANNKQRVVQEAYKAASGIRRRVRPGRDQRFSQQAVLKDYVHDANFVRHSRDPEDMETLLSMMKPLTQQTRATRGTVLGSTNNPELPYAQQKRIVAAIKEGRYEDLFGMRLNFRGPGSYTTRRETDFSPFIGDLSNPTLKAFSNGFMTLKDQKEEIAQLRKVMRSGKFKKLTPGTAEYARALGMTGLWSPARSWRPGPNPTIGSDWTVEQVLANKIRDYNNRKKQLNKAFPDKKIQQLLIDEMVGSGALAIDVPKAFYKHPRLPYRGDHIENLVKKENEILLGDRTSQITGVASDLRTRLPSLITQSGAQGFNRGNIVPGTGNTDTVPAMLTPGEFVVNKESTKKNYDLLTAINNSQKLNKGGIAYQGSREAPPGLAMNSGGMIKGYRFGGIIKSLGNSMGGAQAVSSIAGMTIGQQVGGGLGSMVGMFALPMITGMIGKKLGPALGKTTKDTEAMGDAVSGLGKVAKNLGPRMSLLGGPVGIAVAAFAVVGFAAYKLNKSLVNAEKSGAALSDAMYGSAKTTKAMADAFGRETYATAARRKAAEKAGGQEITQEAVATSGEFMKSDAAKGIIKDIKLVEKSGGDAVLALRNQLASSIIAGVISPEEARAIALDVGKELGSATLGVQVSGELTSLIGPNGEKILDNVLEITAEISPKINAKEIQKDAQQAFDSLNPGEQFVQFFKGGKDSFIENYSIDEISAKNTSALIKEAEARALLNLAYQEGTITLQQYLDQEGKITSSANERSKFFEDANAQSLGFSSTKDMNSESDKYIKLRKESNEFSAELSRKIREEGYSATPEDKQRSQGYGTALAAESEGKKAYDAIVKKSKDSLKQSFVDAGMDENIAKTMTDSMEQGVAQIDPGIFDKFLSGQIPLEGYDVLMNLESSGDLTLEDIDRLGKELTALTTIPKIDKVINFETANEEMITEAYDAYMALEKEPDIFKGISIKDGKNKDGTDFLALDQMHQFGINYQWIMSLPNQEKFIVLTTIERHVKLKSAAISGDRDDRLALGPSNAELAKLVENTVVPQTGPTGPTGNGGKSGDAKSKFDDLKNMLMERFRLQEMLIDKEAEGFNKRIKNISREIQLQQRQVALEEKQIEVRQKALSELSKKEEEVNTAYNNRTSALDRVSASNSRLASQEQSRISFASALASGDIAGAASAMAEITQQSAENQIEDSKAALETQRETALKNLTVDVNGTLMTRKDIEASIETIQKNIDAIQTSIYDKNILIQGLEDELLKTEDKRLKVAQDREKIETRLYLMKQKDAINELNKKKNKKQLTAEEKQALADYKASYNSMATFYNSQNPDNPIQLLNLGGQVSGTGMTDKVPAMLTPGEFVVRKNAAQAFLPVLQSINSGLFPSVGGMNLDSPRYNVPANNITNVPVSQSITNSSNASTMYNNSYSINVNVSGSNSSADEIANVVMGKIARSNSGSIRGSRY